MLCNTKITFLTWKKNPTHKQEMPPFEFLWNLWWDLIGKNGKCSISFSTLFFLTLSLVVSEMIILQVSKTLCAQPWCRLSIAMKNSDSSIIKRLQTVRTVQPPLFYFYHQLFLYPFFPDMLMWGARGKMRAIPTMTSCKVLLELMGLIAAKGLDVGSLCLN